MMNPPVAGFLLPGTRPRDSGRERETIPRKRDQGVDSNVVSGLICLVLGSVLGGAARYFVSGFIARRMGETFPWGTVIVNISGALAIVKPSGASKSFD